jgi:hypothetical protein
MEIGPQHLKELRSRLFLEDCHKVNALQGCNDLGTLFLRLQRPAGSFERSHRGVAVDSYKQDVAEGLCGLQVPYVPDMDEVEAAIAENKSSSAGLSVCANP